MFPSAAAAAEAAWLAELAAATAVELAYSHFPAGHDLHPEYFFQANQQYNTKCTVNFNLKWSVFADTEGAESNGIVQYLQRQHTLV